MTTQISTVLTDDQKAAYSAGNVTHAELAAASGVSVAIVSKALLGVTKPTKRKYSSTKHADRNAEIVRLFTEEKLTLRALGEKFSCSHQNISLVLKRAGVDPGAALVARHQERSVVATKDLTEKREARIAERAIKVTALSDLWRAGAKVEDIRVACGLKSIGATNVKIVLLRRKFPTLFPLRNHRKSEAAPVTE